MGCEEQIAPFLSSSSSAMRPARRVHAPRTRFKALAGELREVTSVFVQVMTSARALLTSAFSFF